MNPIVRYAEWIIRWRRPVLFGSLIVAGILGAGASNLAFTNDYRVFFSKANPQLEAFESM